MLSDEWLSRYGLLENFNASVTRTRTGTRTGTGTGTGTWTTGVTAIALCTSCSRAKKRKLKSEFQYLYLHFILSIKYQIFNCAYHRSFSCYLTLNPTKRNFGTAKFSRLTSWRYATNVTTTRVNKQRHWMGFDVGPPIGVASRSRDLMFFIWEMKNIKKDTFI